MYNLWTENRLQSKLPFGIEKYSRKYASQELCNILKAMPKQLEINFSFVEKQKK